MAEVAASNRIGGLVLGWRRDGDGVGPESRLSAEGRRHRETACGHAHAYHVLPGGQHRVVADGARVAGIVHGNHADSDVFGLVDGDLHGLGPEDHGQPAVGVYRGRAR